MRCLFFVLSGFLVICSGNAVKSQGITDSVYNIKARNDLPAKELKSKFRLQIYSKESALAGSIFADAKEITAKFKLNTYIIRQKKLVKLNAGDFSEKKYAKQRLSYLKRKFPKVKVVKTENDSIIEFFAVEKKKPVKNMITPVPNGNPDPRYSIRIEPPLQPADSTKKLKTDKDSANTACNEEYLSDEEKRVYYFLNLARINPKHFADTYLSYLKPSRDHYESSLYSELQKLQPLPVLKPNRKLFESAKCHAVESGEKGYVGHERFKCTQYFMGECCQYGVSEALEIVIHLLIDQGIPSLGHRKICLSAGYTELGVSIQPHKTYGINTVLDFR